VRLLTRPSVWCCCGAQLDSKEFLNVINEIAEIKSCNSCLFFEVRKKRDLFLWMSKTPLGPSVKFHVLNGVLSSLFVLLTVALVRARGAAAASMRA
jgi:hypothetical protein